MICRLGMAIVFSALALPAARLSLETITGTPGDRVTLEIQFAAQGANASNIQFHLDYDALALDVTAKAGPAATSAGRRLTSVESPFGKRLVVAGGDQKTLADGIVVVLQIAIKAGASGRIPLRASYASASDRNGAAISLTVQDGAVVVGPAVQQPVAGLTGDDIATAPGFAVTLPVRLSTNGSAIAAIQFDVEFDPDTISIAFARGEAAIDTVKIVTATDLATNPARFIVYGLNRNVMRDGVLLNLSIVVRSGVPTGVYPLRLTAVSAVDPDGSRVQVAFRGGSFAVGSSPLSIREMHTGNFFQGQTGAVYTILISSNASQINGGAVVSDTVPAGLMATSMSGTGWNCIQPSGTCSRLDPLAAGGSYPPITLTVDVSRSAPATVMNRATVMGVGINEVVTVDPTSISPYPQTPAQLVSGLTPAVNSGRSQTVTLTFNAPPLGNSLDVVNMLINTSLDGRKACYWAYVVPQQTLFLVDDEGDAAGPYQASVPASSQPASNSQCAVGVVSVAGGGNGNGLTLVLNLTFSGSFAGNKTVFVAARDTGGINSGWQIVGTQAVPPLPQTFPNPVGVIPPSGRNSGQTVTVTYQDQTDAANLQTMWLLINSALDGRSACYVAYYRPANQVFLVPDSGDGSQAIGLSLTSGATITNSQCTISTQGAAVTAKGDTLSVSLPIAFKNSFAGFKGVWLAAQAAGGGQASMWQPLGVWTITPQN